MILICFAVKEERRHFRPAITPDLRVAITGMGASAAESAFVRALNEADGGPRPTLVLTCGFAGGLNTAIVTGSVLFDADDEVTAGRLRGAGAVPARFHCASRVAVTRAEKAALRRETQADAVEMESGVIRRLCSVRGIPSATVRVISDAADEDLPIDFNPLITSSGTLRLGGLIGQVLRRPGSIPGMLALQRKTGSAAMALGRCLERFLTGLG